LDSMSDMQRSSEFRPRSVRRPRVGSLVRGASGSLQMAPGQGGAARGVLGAGQEGVTVQGGLGIPSSQGFTTIHPVIESMETGEVEQMDL